MPFGSALGGDDFEPGYGAIEPGDPRGYAERIKAAVTVPVAEYRDLVESAAEETRLARLLSSRTEAMADAADQRIRTVQEQTGVQLENPFRQGYLMEANRRYDDARARGEDPGPRSITVRQLQRDIFTENVDGVATKFPDKAAALTFFQPIEAQAGAIATAAEDRAGLARTRFGAAGGNAADEFVAELAGGLRGSWRDPVSVASLAIGPGLSASRSILARVATAGATQGLVNVGLLALEKPAANAWRQERGLSDQGNLPTLHETGLAFALGAIPGAGIQGVIEVRAIAALKRVMAGDARPGDMPAAMHALGVKADDELLAALEAGRREIHADEVALSEIPAGSPKPMADDAAAQALRHGLDPANEPRAPLLPRIADGATDDAADAAMRGVADPLDGVERLRADPALIDSALSSSRPDMQIAGRLATLSDEAFAMVRDGADPLHGAIAAELTPFPRWQAEVLDMITKANARDLRDARLIASDTVDALIDREATAREAARQQLAADDANVRGMDPAAAYQASLARDLARGDVAPLKVKDADRAAAFMREIEKGYDAGIPQKELAQAREDGQLREPAIDDKDPINMRIAERADGTAELVARGSDTAGDGARERFLSELIAECKV